MRDDGTATTASRARATPSQATRAAVDEQVRHVTELMAAHAWNDATAARLASEWGITLAAVHDRAAQASRFMRLLISPAEREALRTTWLAVLHDGITSPAVEFRDKVQAIRVGAPLAGLAAPPVEPDATRFAGMTKAEKVTLLRNALAELEAEPNDVPMLAARRGR